jgi:hypothetical protein
MRPKFLGVITTRGDGKFDPGDCKKFPIRDSLKETTQQQLRRTNSWSLKGARMMLDAKEKVAGFHPKGGNMGGVVPALKMNCDILSSLECGL